MNSAAAALACAVLLHFAPVAGAQDLNVDCSFDSTPSAQYGAASGQTGYWNRFDWSFNFDWPLLDLSGQPTNASATTSDGCDTYTCAFCNSGVCPGFAGSADDAALLGSWINADCGPGPQSVFLHGLEPGRYVIYLYTYGCSNPPSASVGTFVNGTLVGSFVNPGQVWQGSWAGFPVGRHAFNVAQGDTVQLSFTATFVTGLAGFQIDKLEPIGQVSCPGDGTGAACPCGNSGILGHGCRNSATLRGAELEAVGTASLSFDTLGLHCTFVKPGATSIALQGDLVIAPVAFGDGLRCAGGNLKRLYTANASASGTLSAPLNGGLSISARSSVLGDTLPIGAQRIYQVYYRDSNPNFCPAPQGSTFNISNAVEIAWQG